MRLINYMSLIYELKIRKNVALLVKGLKWSSCTPSYMLRATSNVVSLGPLLPIRGHYWRARRWWNYHRGGKLARQDNPCKKVTESSPELAKIFSLLISLKIIAVSYLALITVHLPHVWDAKLSQGLKSLMGWPKAEGISHLHRHFQLTSEGWADGSVQRSGCSPEKTRPEVRSWTRRLVLSWSRVGRFPVERNSHSLQKRVNLARNWWP